MNGSKRLIEEVARLWLGQTRLLMFTRNWGKNEARVQQQFWDCTVIRSAKEMLPRLMGRGSQVSK